MVASLYLLGIISFLPLILAGNLLSSQKKKSVTALTPFPDRIDQQDDSGTWEPDTQAFALSYKGRM